MITAIYFIHYFLFIFFIRLACDEECFVAERNRNLALALQIDPNNPTANKQTKILYSDYLKTFAREDADFALYVEKGFADLIKDLNNVSYFILF